jgi:hypothetical protein
MGDPEGPDVDVGRGPDLVLWLLVALMVLGAGLAAWMTMFLKKGRDGGIGLLCSFTPTFFLLEVVTALAASRVSWRLWLGDERRRGTRSSPLLILLIPAAIAAADLLLFATCAARLAGKGVR